MPLKKPSEFYDKNPNSSFDDIKEELKNSKPEKVEKISEAFDSFKSNLNNIQALNDFTEKFDTFQSNIEKVETLTNSVEEIRESVKGLIGQKDLDDAMMAHLLFVEESIRNVQDKVKTLNSNSVLEIKNEFENLTGSVSQFLGEEVPSYKKLIVDSEARIDERFGGFKQEVKTTLEEIGKDVYTEIASIVEGVEGLNEESLTSIREEVSGIGDKVKALLEEELPQYNKFFAEAELKTEDRIDESERFVDQKIESLEETYKDDIKGIEKTIRRQKKELTESKIKTEKGINKLFKDLATDIVTLDEKLAVLDIGVTAVQEKVEGKGSEIDDILADKITKIEDLVTESKTLSDTLKRDLKHSEISSDRKLEDYSTTLTSTLSSFAEKIEVLENSLNDNICELQENLDVGTTKYHDDIKSNVEKFEEEFSQQLKDININFTVNEKHIDGLRKDFGDVVEKLRLEEIEEKNISLTNKVRHLEEVLEKFDEKEILTEGLLNIPPNVKNSDPLTPLDQNYATLEDLQKHYRIFINRVQQQIATLGGGGIEDAPYDGQTYSRRDRKWVVGGGAGVGGTWASNDVGVHTIRNVGINTTSAKSDYALWVGGKMGVEGDLEYDEATARNWNITGVATAAKLHVGAGTTWPEDLVVNGDTRILGILTVGSSSIVIDGSTEEIRIGGEDKIRITNSKLEIGAGVTISASASGINSAPNVLYVAKDGDDKSNGTSIDNAFLTIKAAVGAAQSGTTVKILSGRYEENNPISVPAFVSVVGDDQRTVTVLPSNERSDLFHVRKGTKLASMTFSGHLAPAAAVSFPTGDDIAENVGGGKWKGPYIQNCTSDTTTGTGLYIDGDQARSLKAMNVDGFTQYNQGGVGVAITNGGFAQLVSLFTICCNEAVTADKGGQADIANSNCSFGTYGLVSRGVSDLQYSGIVTTTSAVSQAQVAVNVNTNPVAMNGFVYDHLSGIATATTAVPHGFSVGMGVTLANINMSCAYGNKTYPYQKPFVFDVEAVPDDRRFVVNIGVSTVAHTYANGGTAKIDVDRPYDGQLVYFDTLYKTVEKIAVGSGGTGYTATPTVTVAAPTGPSGETATAFATLEGDSISSITIISSGSQYTGTPNVTIGAPQEGSNTATATASMEDLYYTINSSTPVSSGISTLTLATNLLNTVGVGSTAFFSQGSRIVASSHTFEYVGAGNLIVTATPKRGGVTNQLNEVVTESGGKVLYTSTDQAGNFRIGDDLQINQETGTISGRSFSKSLFSEMTPFILALS